MQVAHLPLNLIHSHLIIASQRKCRAYYRQTQEYSHSSRSAVRSGRKRPLWVLGHPQSPNRLSDLMAVPSPSAWRHLTVFLAHPTSPRGDRCFRWRLGSYTAQISELLKCCQRFPADFLLTSDPLPGFRQEEMFANAGAGCRFRPPWI